MPAITIDQPPFADPNTKVSRYLFTAYGEVQPATDYSVRCELIPDGTTTPVASVDPCPLYTSGNVTTWVAAFFGLAEMTDCAIRATRTATGAGTHSYSHDIDLVSIPPDIIKSPIPIPPITTVPPPP